MFALSLYRTSWPLRRMNVTALNKLICSYHFEELFLHCVIASSERWFWFGWLVCLFGNRITWGMLTRLKNSGSYGSILFLDEHCIPRAVQPSATVSLQTCQNGLCGGWPGDHFCVCVFLRGGVYLKLYQWTRKLKLSFYNTWWVCADRRRLTLTPSIVQSFLALWVVVGPCWLGDSPRILLRWL